jgi:hypothetical protein
MRVAIGCPGCKRSISVQEEALGKWIACPRCGMEFAAMRSEPTTEAPEIEYIEPRPGSPLLVVGWSLAGIFFLLSLIFGIVAAKSSSHAQAMWAKVPQSSQSRAQEVSKHEDTAVTAISWLFVFWVIIVLYLVILILMLAWVARDSRNRGVDGGAVWVIAVFITGVVGLLVYLASRPHGILIVCEHCNNKKLNFAKLCPHCGYGEAKRRKVET